MVPKTFLRRITFRKLKGVNKMEITANYKQNLLDVIEEKQKLECKVYSSAFWGYVGGFLSGGAFVILMWLLHR